MLRLYYSPGACSVAVHIVLEEIGVDYELERVNLLEEENRRESFLAINPYGRVPVLSDNEGVLRETPALLTHLALAFPEAGLLPPIGTHEFARALEWLSWISSSAHANLLRFWRPFRVAPQDSDLQAISRVGWNSFRDDCFEIEEKLVGPWFLGERFTVIDPFLLFCFRQGNRIQLPMSDLFPKFTAWAGRMLARPAVARVWAREGINIDGDVDRLRYKRPLIGIADKDRG